MAKKSTAPPPATFPRLVLLAVLFLAVAGSAISGFLVQQKLAGKIPSLAGCGQAGGCSNLLGGRWSVWFGLPVSAGGLLAYLGLAMAALLELRRPESRWRAALVALSGLAFFSALWFTGLQFSQKTFCPYCSSIHACGAAIFALLTGALVRQSRAGSDTSFTRPGIACAAVAGAMLVAGQLMSEAPPSHEIVTDSAPVRSAPVPATTGTGRVVEFLGGDMKFEVNRWPIIGSPSAKHVVVEMFDYTCANCQRLHAMFQEIKPMTKDLAVIYLPLPLNRQCTPNLKPGVEDHANACEYARMALAFWEADRAKFPEYHDFLFRAHASLTPALAEQKAAELIGQERWQKAKSSPWVEQTLKDNAARYERLSRSSIAMPKVLLTGQQVMQGTPPNSAQLMEVLRKSLSL